MILPIILIGLLIVSLIAAAMVQTVLLQRRTARQAEQQLQAGWLADSGLLRARQRLATNADYTGETWELSPGEAQAGIAATVVITVEPADDARRIMVDATYPSQAVRRTREHRELLVTPIRPGGTP